MTAWCLFARRVSLAALALALAACGGNPTRPDLGRLYRVGTQFADTTPVIVIPGVFGSKLRDRSTGVEAWPGTARMILFDDYRYLALDFDRETLAVRPDNDPSAPQNEDSIIPIAYWFFLCEHHTRLTGNINFQDNLLNVLLTRSLPWEMSAPAQ